MDLTKKYRTIIRIIFLLALSLVVTCKNNTDPQPQPELGDIIGTVNLYDDGVNSIDNAGMTISINGSS